MKKNYYVLIAIIVASITFQGCYSLKKSEDYYGIKTEDIKNVVFILDISGSMENIAEKNVKGELINTATNYAADKTSSLVSNTIGGEAGSIAGSLLNKNVKKSVTKLQKARKKLIPAIKGLPETTMFEIIVFENGVKTWRKNLVPATKTNKLEAQAYIEALKAGGGTNIYDAVNKAFELAGDGAKDSTIAVNVETIFLLSDGAPSAGPVTKPDDIRKDIKTWNNLQRIKIHSIGLGDDCDENFMRGLAEDNGGIYIDK